MMSLALTAELGVGNYKTNTLSLLCSVRVRRWMLAKI